MDGLLGKMPPVHDPATVRLANYVKHGQLPDAPTSTERALNAEPRFQMFDNDRIGDCTCAGVGNAVAFWTALSGRPDGITVDDVLHAYETITGYNPTTGANDNGAVEIDVLEYWAKVGVGGHTIAGYAAIDLMHTNTPVLVESAIWTFDGAYLGVALPLTAQGEDVWDVDQDGGSAAYPGSWGGHCVFAVDYSPAGVVVATWGATKLMTWDFFDAYVDEAYAVISDDALNATSGKTAEGYDLSALRNDLGYLAN